MFSFLFLFSSDILSNYLVPPADIPINVFMQN
jgi:ABC-type Fe3+-siderophore transport system permease subunit